MVGATAALYLWSPDRRDRPPRGHRPAGHARSSTWPTATTTTASARTREARTRLRRARRAEPCKIGLVEMPCHRSWSCWASCSWWSAPSYAGRRLDRSGTRGRRVGSGDRPDPGGGRHLPAGARDRRSSPATGAIRRWRSATCWAPTSSICLAIIGVVAFTKPLTVAPEILGFDLWVMAAVTLGAAHASSAWAARSAACQGGIIFLVGLRRYLSSLLFVRG